MSYDTHQKRLVLDCLADSGRAMSASEIASAVPQVGSSSVYRILSQALEEGVVAASRNGRVRLFSYVGRCHHHLHASCMRCGALVHMDEDSSRRMERLLEGQGLSIAEDAVIPCICSECRRIGR